MSVSDPAQLLQRIPELEALATDPKIRRAIETGDPFKVYRALVWAKWLRRLPAHRTVLDALVRQRRLFAKPLNGNPALGSINSVGFGFVGQSEKEPDGTHIALHAFVVLYILPIIPLNSYLVQKTDSSFFSSQWRIFARVPASMFGWLYARGLALGLVGLVGWGAVNSYYKSVTQDVMVVNGFEVPVNVVLNGKQQTIAPQGHATITVDVGDLEGKATAKQGVVIDTLKRTITSQGGYSIWNIAGAAPLFRETVPYFKVKPATLPAEPEPTVYCGQRYIEVGGVDDAFTEPPQTVSMSKYEDRVNRVHLDIAKTPGQSGINTCNYYLFSRDKADQATGFLEAAAELGGWEYAATNLAMFAAGKKSSAEAIRIAQRALKVKPDDVRLHRLYQSVKDDAGQVDQLVQEYAELARSKPDSASAQYLYAALMRGTDGLAAVEQLAVRFDKDPNILRSLTWRRMVHGDFAGANKSWALLHDLSPKDADEVIDAQVLALVAQKKMEEAKTVLSGSLHDANGGISATRAAEFAMVVNLAGGDSRRVLGEMAKDAKDGEDFDHIRVRAGLEPAAATEKQSALVKLGLALRDNPAQALRIGSSLTYPEYVALGPEQWALLYGEAVRTNNQPLATRLEHFVSSTSYSDRDILKKFVRGEDVSLNQANLEPGVRAAALFVRSRNASLAPQERAELRDRAAQADLLHSVVTSALIKWPV